MARCSTSCPGNLAQMAQQAGGQVEDKAIRRIEGIINSMTPLERTAGADQGQPQAPHRAGAGVSGAGGEPVAQPVRADAEDDEAVRQGRHGEDDALDEGHVSRHALLEVCAHRVFCTEAPRRAARGRRSRRPRQRDARAPRALQPSFSLNPFARMNAPKSARSGTAYWRALSSDHP
jgi:hypothetical protein